MSAVMVGAGQRGRHVYGAHALDHPNDLRFVAVADPRPERRTQFAQMHGIGAADEHESWEQLLAGSQVAEACIIATWDPDHCRPAIAALEAGYEVLVEKPMAATLADAAAMVTAAEAARGSLHVAHVLRYTPFFQTLHDVVASGRLGEIVTVEHRENVVAWHMAHSFVRGNWARAAQASPMIVQKCCHDFDILVWNVPSPVRRLTSFGSLLHFYPENAPAGAPGRCTDGCPVAAECPFEAQRIYLDESRRGWPVHVITDDLSPSSRLEALRTGPWGRCVYYCESDVVDHQTVNMELESGATMVLTMHGHSHEESRTMRYDGTRATLRAKFGATSSIEVTDHTGGKTTAVPIESAPGGHGGGDTGLIRAFLRAVRDGRSSLTDASGALESHLLAFAAEDARLSGKVIDVAEVRRRC